MTSKPAQPARFAACACLAAALALGCCTQALAQDDVPLIFDENTLPPMPEFSVVPPFTPPAINTNLPDFFGNTPLTGETAKFADDDADTANPALGSAFFRRSNLTHVTLSPDGQFLAFATKGAEPRIVVTKAADLVDIVTTKSLPKNPAVDTADVPVPLNWLGWVAPDRLVAAIEMPFNSLGSTARGSIVAMNADGSANTTLLTPLNVQKIGFMSPGEIPSARPSGSSPARDTPTAGFDYENFLESAADAERDMFESPNNAGFFDFNSDNPFSSTSGGGMRLSTRPDGRGVSDLASARTERQRGASTGSSMMRASGPARLPVARSQPLRSVSVIGYVHDDPQSILVRAQSLLAYGIHKLNVITGKYSRLAEQVPSDLVHVLHDRQGRIGIEQPSANDKRFPHVYRYRGSVAPRGDLDKLFTPPALAPASGAPHSALRAPRSAFTVSPENVFGERSIPIGFDTDPAILYYASNVGRDTYGIYGYDLKKRAPTGLAIEDPERDLFIPPVTGFPRQPVLVWNRHTHALAGVIVEGAPRTTRWLNPAFQQLQQILERRLPGRNVTILEWSADETKFLVQVDGPADPGAHYIYDAPAKTLTLFTNLAEGLDAATMPIVSEIDMTAPDGARLTGMLSMPRHFPTKTIPVIVLCPATPWERRLFEYRPEPLMLASLGYMVIEMNPRGAPGEGLKKRQTLPATATVTHAADIITLLDELAKHFPINPKRVALVGEKYGGYMALRALQIHGERFSCAVAIDAPVDPKKWLDDMKLSTADSEPLLCATHYDTPEEWKARPLFTQTRLIQRPIYLLNRYAPPRYDRGGMTMIQAGESMFDDARQLVDMVRSQGVKANDMEPYFEALGGRSRSALFWRVERYIRAVHTNARVIFGPMQIIETGVPMPLRR